MLVSQIQTETQRSFYELAPIVPISSWWQLLLMIAVLALLGGLSVWLYRTDSARLPRMMAVLLTSLRLTAFIGILIFFLGPQRRSEIQIVKPSRVAILVDTSLSMGLIDDRATNATNRRIDDVVELFGNSPLVDDLRKDHELLVYRFDESNQVESVVNLPRLSTGSPSISIDEQRMQQARDSLVHSRKIGRTAQIILGTGILAIFANGALLLVGSRKFLLLAVGAWCLVIGFAAVAVCDLVSSEFDWRVSLGWREVDESAFQLANDTSDAEDVEIRSLHETDWKEELHPRGAATQLGPALLQLVKEQRGSSIAAIILASDGQHNQGTSPTRAIYGAVDANIPVFTLGFGSRQQNRNIRVSDIQAPSRVFPGDRFTVKAVMQANGLAGQSAVVQLLSIDQEETEAETLEDEQQVILPSDDEPMVVDFKVLRQEEGRRRYMIRVVNALDIDAQDDEASTIVEIIQRRTRVLLVAGGPSRDYQFLRNQLFRDRDVELDVWLQLAKTGADQESDQLLFEFPKTPAEMDQYDCLVAFDPDWRLLSVRQAELLERWVSYKAGGIIVVTGPVYTPEWTRQPRGNQTIDLIRRLYPVSFYSQGSAALKLGRFGGDQAFPLAFTREGETADFLKLGDSFAESADSWTRFKGVYGYYAVNEPKPGATILANFSDPSTAIDGQLPIYLASHFYGAGRVLFQASGEVWRLREVDVNHFQRYYLNAIRWVSQGRLLRDSSQGVLLVDRQRAWVGDPITLRALLRDAADQPLLAPSVVASIERPDGVAENVEMMSEGSAASPGAFSARYVTEQEGTYRIQLPVPGSPDDILTTEINAAIPDLERKDPRRNDALLGEIADKTGGKYFIGKSTPVEQDGLASQISKADQETFLPGTPDSTFATKLMGWLVGWLTLILGLEWTIRRFQKLA